MFPREFDLMSAPDVRRRMLMSARKHTSTYLYDKTLLKRPFGCPLVSLSRCIFWGIKGIKGIKGLLSGRKGNKTEKEI